MYTSHFSPSFFPLDSHILVFFPFVLAGLHQVNCEVRNAEERRGWGGRSSLLFCPPTPPLMLSLLEA